MTRFRFARRANAARPARGLPRAAAGAARPAARETAAVPRWQIVGPSAGLGHGSATGSAPGRPRRLAALDRRHRRRRASRGCRRPGGCSAAGFEDLTLSCSSWSPRPGAPSRLRRVVGLLAYPWGAHYLPVPMKENRALLRLFREMGVVEGEDADGEPLVGEEHLVRDPRGAAVRLRPLARGAVPARRRERPEDRAQLRAVRAEVGLRGSLPRRQGPPGVRHRRWPHGSDDAEVTALDRLSMAEWLDAQAASPRRGCAGWSITPAATTTAPTPRDVSAWAGLFYFASRARERPRRRVAAVLTLARGQRPARRATWPSGSAERMLRLGPRRQPDVRPRGRQAAAWTSSPSTTRAGVHRLARRAGDLRRAAVRGARTSCVAAAASAPPGSASSSTASGWWRTCT